MPSPLPSFHAKKVSHLYSSNSSRYHPSLEDWNHYASSLADITNPSRTLWHISDITWIPTALLLADCKEIKKQTDFRYQYCNILQWFVTFQWQHCNGNSRSYAKISMALQMCWMLDREREWDQCNRSGHILNKRGWSESPPLCGSFVDPEKESETSVIDLAISSTNGGGQSHLHYVGALLTQRKRVRPV